MFKKVRPQHISQLMQKISIILEYDFVSDDSKPHLLFLQFSEIAPELSVTNFFMFYDRENKLVYNRFFFNDRGMPRHGPR